MTVDINKNNTYNIIWVNGTVLESIKQKSVKDDVKKEEKDDVGEQKDI